MRMKIYSCLLVFVLCCNGSSEKKHKIIRLKDSVTLPCPHPVEGKVTWSRERNGNRVDILTVDGDGDIRHIHDPLKRYSSSVDKSLHISNVTVSDTGTYFCNNEAAVELTVIQDLKTTILSTPAATSTAPSTPIVNTDRQLLYGVVFGIGAILLIFLIFLIFLVLLVIIVLFTRRYRQQTRDFNTTSTNELDNTFTSNRDFNTTSTNELDNTFTSNRDFNTSSTNKLNTFTSNRDFNTAFNSTNKLNTFTSNSKTIHT
ncbi:uncharacterized protein LOC123976177 [Micropterus dolomieu]|uniref:uncharacterized protein LOC123976177 n=1 Tax=Micropterus dolomieu TaxID=147949 RepID=UPI001E8E2272|nr:uncharacterized protein LOC123976177 [Micropterus dolomieu]